MESLSAGLLSLSPIFFFFHASIGPTFFLGGWRFILPKESNTTFTAQPQQQQKSIILVEKFDGVRNSLIEEEVSHDAGIVSLQKLYLACCAHNDVPGEDGAGRRSCGWKLHLLYAASFPPSRLTPLTYYVAIYPVLCTTGCFPPQTKGNLAFLSI